MDTLSLASGQPALSAAQKAMTAAETLFQLSRSNVEAVTKANQILVAGVQDLLKTQAEAAKLSMSEAMSTLMSFGTVKSVKDMLDIQSGLMRTSMERTLESYQKMSASSMQLTEQAFAPIKAQMALASEKLGHIG